MTGDRDRGSVIGGKYRLLDRISGGGMGSVWRAHHAQLDAPVAVKFMHHRLLDDPEALVRFEREAKAAARIRSPHVVHVYDHGVDASGVPYMVMEYLEGEDLDTRLKRIGKLPLDRAVALCNQLARGLSRAHALGIVHRDLKPGNIFLCPSDDDLVKIVDFGIAKETGEQRVVAGETRAGTLLGSPHYMSPEQARGLELDRRSDLWSLAAILFRAITGRRPFRGHDFGDLAVRICSDPIPSASSIDGSLGPALDRFFWRAFDRNPAGRFQTAEELAAAFAEAAASPPAPRAKADLELPVLPPKRLLAVSRPTTHVRERVIIGGLHKPQRSGVWLLFAVLLVGGVLVLAFFPQLFQQLTSAPAASATASVDVDPQTKQVRQRWETLYTQVRSNEIPQAVESLALLVQLEPSAPRDKRNTILDLAERALERRDRTSERMAVLMTTGMGEDGPDLLFDLMATRIGTQAAKEAERILADAAVRRLGSKDMNLAHAIFTAASCPQKKVNILRAKEGGERTLREIRALTSDCHKGACCFENDASVKAVENALAANGN